MSEPISIIPPDWFVANVNAGVQRDWVGTGPPPVRTKLDPLVMSMWAFVSADCPQQLVVITSCA